MHLYCKKNYKHNFSRRTYSLYMQVYNKIGNGKRIKERDKRITKEKKEENATPVIQA